MMKKIDPITKLLVLLFSMLLILTACNVRTYGDPNAEPDSGSGKATKHYDNFVYLTNPPENYTFAANAPPPVFSWDIKKPPLILMYWKLIIRGTAPIWKKR